MPKPPNRQKILVVVGKMPHGGVQRNVSRLSQVWAKTHQVTVAVFDTSQQAYQVGGRIHDLKSAPDGNAVKRAWRWVQNAIRLAQFIRPQHFDRIIAFGDYANFRLILSALITGNLSRVTISVRGTLRYKKRRDLIVIRLLYAFAPRIVVVSRGIQQQLIELGIGRSKIKFIPNSVAPMKPEARTRPKFPQSKNEAKYILAVGRLHRQKGFDLLLPAYASLAKTAPPLVILGEGAARQALTGLATSLGIGDRVHFIGSVDNPQNWYAHAECFVLSSRWEGMPNVLLEAMAHACPVVSFACPTGPDEIITHGKNGLLVAAEDVAGLTAAIAKMLHDTKLRQRLGKAGQARTKDFAITTLAPRWLEK